MVGSTKCIKDLFSRCDKFGSGTILLKTKDNSYFYCVLVRRILRPHIAQCMVINYYNSQYVINKIVSCLG